MYKSMRERAVNAWHHRTRKQFADAIRTATGEPRSACRTAR